MRAGLSANRRKWPDTLSTAWFEGVAMTEKPLDVSPTAKPACDLLR
jgi:hypothetical protein